MSKICPNCMHTVRAGANYCGYCGTILVPSPQNPAPTEPPSSKVNAKADSKVLPQVQPKSKIGIEGRAWVKIPIILLALVILVALVLRFWPEITTYFGHTLPFLKAILISILHKI